MEFSENYAKLVDFNKQLILICKKLIDAAPDDIKKQEYNRELKKLHDDYLELTGHPYTT